MTGQPPDHRLASWVDRAACRGHDPDIFLDDRSNDRTDSRTAEALATCARCPVRHSCLQLGLAQPAGADIGIWGGTTRADREALRRGRANTIAHTNPTDNGDTTAVQDLRTHEPDEPREVVRHFEHGPPVPEVRLGRDRWGVHHDDTGRIQVCDLARPPRRMVLLDGHPIARVTSLTEARRAAWRALHAAHERTSAHDIARSRR